MSILNSEMRHDAFLTPDIHPELFQTGLAEAVQSDDESSSTSKSCAANQAIDSREAADVKRGSSSTKQAYHDDLADLVLNHSSWRQHQ